MEIWKERAKPDYGIQRIGKAESNHRGKLKVSEHGKKGSGGN